MQRDGCLLFLRGKTPSQTRIVFGSRANRFCTIISGEWRAYPFGRVLDFRSEIFFFYCVFNPGANENFFVIHYYRLSNLELVFFPETDERRLKFLSKKIQGRRLGR